MLFYPENKEKTENHWSSSPYSRGDIYEENTGCYRHRPLAWNPLAPESIKEFRIVLLDAVADIQCQRLNGACWIERGFYHEDATVDDEETPGVHNGPIRVRSLHFVWKLSFASNVLIFLLHSYYQYRKAAEVSLSWIILPLRSIKSINNYIILI